MAGFSLYKKEERDAKSALSALCETEDFLIIGLFFAVALTVKWTAATTARAGGDTLLFVLHHSDDDKREYQRECQSHEYSTDIFKKKIEHIVNLTLLFHCIYARELIIRVCFLQEIFCQPYKVLRAYNLRQTRERSCLP